MGEKRKNIPIPHIPLKFEDAVDAFLKTKPPKKGKKAAAAQPKKKAKKRVSNG
jgi:hypothetical protein